MSKIIRSYTLEAVATRMGVSKATLTNWYKQGRLPKPARFSSATGRPMPLWGEEQLSLIEAARPKRGGARPPASEPYNVTSRAEHAGSHHDAYPGDWMPFCRSPRHERQPMLDEWDGWNR